MNQRNLSSLLDWSTEDIQAVLRLAKDIKAHPENYKNALAGKTLGMIFEKKSTRTRVSFEVGIYQLGGVGLFLSSNDMQLGRGETIADTSRVLSRYLDIIMARVFGQDTIDQLAEWSTIPIINGLSDEFHPCQALTDFFTMTEHFEDDLRGRKFTYIGDGNNMAHSLMLCGAKLGVDVAIGCPEGYQPDPAIVAAAENAGLGAKITVTSDLAEAASNADVIYTDVWASMGQEGEQEERLKAFDGFIVDSALMGHAKNTALFMHCLPAHRGEEVSAEVCDGPQSIIFDQAENRLHTQKAVMVALAGNEG